jgi:hypothetical protein
MIENGFGRTIGFGVAAAVSLVFVQHLGAAWLGSASVAALHGAACVVVYTGLLAETRRAALRNMGAALLGTLVILVLAGSQGTVWIGFALVLAFVRSAVAHGVRSTRVAVIEACLLLAGFAMAQWLSGPGWTGQAFGLWGFALVQSLYFLIPSGGRRAHVSIERDPFDRAMHELSNLLSEP